MRTVLSLSCVLTLVACGNSPPANEPSPASSSTAAPMTSASSAPATPNAPSAPEGKCASATTSSATALDACLAECEKLDDKAPEGSRCVPPRTSCKMACDSKFKK